MIVTRSKYKPAVAKAAEPKVEAKKEKKAKEPKEVKPKKEKMNPADRDSTDRNYMVWYREHKNDSVTREDLEIFEGIGVDLDSVKTIEDIVPLIHLCFQAYVNGLEDSGCLSVEVFARCKNVLSKYSLADILEGKDDIYASVLYKIFVRDAVVWLRGGGPRTRRSLGNFFLLKCCSDLYCFVGGFDIRLYEATLQQYLPTGGVVYDPSMGWGHRLTAATNYDVCEYWGTDPSTDMEPYYRKFAAEHNYVYPPHIYTQGSEVLIPELVGKADLTCTCPPYYVTEKYPSVDGWKSLEEYEEFVQASCDNCYKYLKEGKWSLWFLGDSGNFGKFKLSELYIKCMERAGFKDVKKVLYFHGGVPNKTETKTYWVMGYK